MLIILKRLRFFKCLAIVVCSNGAVCVLHLEVVGTYAIFVSSFLTGVLVVRTNICLQFIIMKLGMEKP